MAKKMPNTFTYTNSAYKVSLGDTCSFDISDVCVDSVKEKTQVWSIYDKNGDQMVILYDDGDIELKQGYDKNEIAKEFWISMHEFFPKSFVQFIQIKHQMIKMIGAIRDAKQSETDEERRNLASYLNRLVEEAEKML